MQRDIFLEYLYTHVKGGRIDNLTFEKIKSYELGGEYVNYELDNSQKFTSYSFFNKVNAMRYSLGVVAGIGSLLVILGFGLLTSLIEDITSDYDNDIDGVELYWLVFSLLAISALLTYKIKLDGRAEVFLGEARSIIFGVSSILAMTHFLEEVVGSNISTEGGFGPLNIFELGPLLGVVVCSMWFARINNAWVSYSLGWILWFVPINYAYVDGEYIGSFFALIIIMGVIISEILREWFDDERKEGSWIQLTGNGLLLGIVGWNIMFAFEEAFSIRKIVDSGGYEYNMDVNNPLMGCIFILGWIIWMEYIKRGDFKFKKYKNSGRSKAWSLVVGCLIFYTFIQNYTGFLIAEWFGFEDVGFGEFDVSVGIIIGCLIHIIMGLQMFKWNLSDVVVRPSLNNPGTFMGSVFLIMGFFTFVGGVIDLLEDLAGYLFLPLGLLVLFIGTKKLIVGNSNEIVPKSIIVGNTNEE